MMPLSLYYRNRPESSEKLTVYGRKAPEIDGKRKQYSESEDRGIISVTFGHFLPDRKGIWLEDTGKIRSFSSPEYCFHEIAGILRNQPFLCRTVRSGYLVLKK
jgi:hypothetical protein